MLSLLFTLCLASPLIAPSRILLVADPTGHGYEQALLFRALMHRVEASPHHVLLTDACPTFSFRAGARFEQRASDLCDRAHRALQSLEPEQARDLAEGAVSLAERAVTYTGSASSLSRALLLAAVAYDALGHTLTAERLLTRAAELTPHLLLDRAIFSPHLQQVVQTALHSDRRRQGRTLALKAHPPEAALFWDGAFVGFGEAQVVMSEAHIHRAVALAPGYSARVQTFASTQDMSTATLALLPDPKAVPSLEVADLLLKSQIAGAFVGPQDSILETWSVDAVWVLRYDTGHAHLTQFDLRAGRRETQVLPCAFTSLHDAEDLARDLAGPFERNRDAG